MVPDWLSQFKKHISIWDTLYCLCTFDPIMPTSKSGALKTDIFGASSTNKSSIKKTFQYELPCTAYCMYFWSNDIVPTSNSNQGLWKQIFLVLQASIQVEGINRASPLQTQNFAYKTFSFFFKGRFEGHITHSEAKIILKLGIESSIFSTISEESFFEFLVQFKIKYWKYLVK